VGRIAVTRGLKLEDEAIPMSEEQESRMQGDVERHRRESDDAEIAAAVERIRARAAEVKILELDWQVLKVDRNAGRPRDFVTSGGSFRKKPGLWTASRSPRCVRR